MGKIFFFVIFSLLIISCKDQVESTASAPRQPKQYSIEQFNKSSQIGGGAFASDDKYMLVSSNESGIFNAYEIDIATGDKKALTASTKESIFANDYVPGTRNIIYSSDKG